MANQLVHSLAFVTVFLLMLLNTAHSSQSLSFTFDRFTPDQKDITLQGRAQIVTHPEHAIWLTSTFANDAGRAVYTIPVRLWEKSTGRLARFETNFTFILTSFQSARTADGLAFFIAPTNTTIPPDSADGYLGLFNFQNGLDPSRNQIVAVEFDTNRNGWDPEFDHVGVLVNSIRTNTYNRFVRRDGAIVSVRIIYTPPSPTTRGSGVLRVLYSYPDLASTLTGYVSLNTELPEWVTIGFSASTNRSSGQVHKLLSWSFSSTLLDNNSNTAAKEEKEDENMYNNNKYNIIGD